MNSYITYYLLWIFVSYALRSPWLLLGLAVLLVLRRFIPAPGALLGLLGRARSLRAQVELNAANVTARRDLAVIYLEGMRARSAIPLLEEGLARSPNDAELLYLLGLALHRAGRHEQALAPLVRAVEIDARVRYGLPYAVAGDALAALKRWDGALDAYEHYLATNGSDVSGYTRLARAQVRTGDRESGRKTLREGLRTWSTLPGSMKRRQFGRYLAAHWARAGVLHEPAAIALVLTAAALFTIAVRFSYGPVLSFFTDSGPWYMPTGMNAEQAALFDGFERCGSQSTGDFAGRYVVMGDAPALSAPAASASAEQRKALEEVERFRRDRNSNLEIRSDRITSGKTLVQEFCLTRVLERTPSSLRAEAVWHEDVADPGDASMVRLELRREGGLTTMRVTDLGEPDEEAALELKLELQK